MDDTQWGEYFVQTILAKSNYNLPLTCTPFKSSSHQVYKLLLLFKQQFVIGIPKTFIPKFPDMSLPWVKRLILHKLVNSKCFVQ